MIWIGARWGVDVAEAGLGVVLDDKDLPIQASTCEISSARWARSLSATWVPGPAGHRLRR